MAQAERQLPSTNRRKSRDVQQEDGNENVWTSRGGKAKKDRQGPRKLVPVLLRCMRRLVLKSIDMSGMDAVDREETLNEARVQH